nr:reverse transcriptase domain-containing protein [Tanacetum cinerariifolium]
MQADLEEEQRIAKQKEEEANIAMIFKWDNTQALMDADYKLAVKLQEEERGELSIEEKSKLFVELMNKRKNHFKMLRAEERKRKPPTKAQKRKQIIDPYSEPTKGNQSIPYIITAKPTEKHLHAVKRIFRYLKGTIDMGLCLAFVEANYEVLESLLREHQRQIRNEDLRTKLEYLSEDYDEEREMEPRPDPNGEATPNLRLRSHVVRRQRERVVGFKEAPNREGNRRGRNTEEKATRSFERPHHMFGSRRSRDMSKYCHFHEDYGYDTNDCYQLRNQIEEAMKSWQLSYLVKGIKKEKIKAFKNQQTEGNKDKSTMPAKTPIHMIRQDDLYMKNKFGGLTSKSKEIIFPSGGSNSSAPPRQANQAKRRGLGPDHNTTTCKEVEELTKTGILQEVKRQTRVANPVMVKKSAEGWRMCVDFININKACLKDYYPLPEIDWKVESLLGFRLKCFLDAYKGYHQIQMAKGDEDNTRGDSDDVPRSLRREHKCDFVRKMEEEHVPIYFISIVIQGAELNYQGMEKLILALVHAARRLRSLTYGSEAIIPIPKNDVAKDDRGRIKEVDKRRGNKEMASIEEAYYRSKLRRNHSERSSQSIYKIRDFVLLSQRNTGGTQAATLHLNINKQVKDLRPHMSLCLIKHIKESDSNSSKSSNMMGDYAPRGSLPPSMAYDIFLQNLQLKATLEPSIHKA